jgi:hypothetical protein
MSSLGRAHDEQIVLTPTSGARPLVRVLAEHVG